MSGELNGNDTPIQAAVPAIGVPEGVAFAEDAAQHNESMKTLVLGALGVVYGDIGTSRGECFGNGLSQSPACTGNQRFTPA